MAKLGVEIQSTGTPITTQMCGIAFYKVMGNLHSANLALELTSGYLSESQLNLCFKQNVGVSIAINDVSSCQLSWKQFITKNPKYI
jgi:hypothetical protein